MPTEKTYTVYKFNELPEESKTLAIEKWRQDDDLLFLEDDIQYHLDELLKEYNITGEGTPLYSLSYCQGDGAMFEGTFDWKDYQVIIKQDGCYYHSYSKYISMYDENNELAPNKVDAEFEGIYQAICIDLEKYGYDVIETAQSDENITEILQANDYDFTLDGKID
jgi:hypothetical protein